MTTVSSPVSSPVTLSDGELNERISGLRKAKADKTITPEQESELRDLLAVANNRLQIIRRNKARESLRTFRKLRNHKAARRLISVHTKEMISAITKNDPDIKGKGTVEQTKAYMDSLASENGMKELEKIFDLVRDCVKAAPDLANRETVFEGNIPACDILFSTFGFKTSSKAVDIDVDSTIAKELIGDATPQE